MRSEAPPQIATPISSGHRHRISEGFGCRDVYLLATNRYLGNRSLLGLEALDCEFAARLKRWKVAEYSKAKTKTNTYHRVLKTTALVAQSRCYSDLDFPPSNFQHRIKAARRQASSLISQRAYADMRARF